MPTYKPDPFYNRSAELAAIDRAWKRHGSGGQMMMLYGRRRLGKTYLLQRYFTGGVSGNESERPHSYYLAEQTTAVAQRALLARQLLTDLPSSGTAEEELAVSWNALLRYVSQQASLRPKQDGRFALILDEFPYLVEQTPELPSIIQAWWDREGTHVPLLVALCGSHLSSMAALGSESAPLFGRFDGGVFQIAPLSFDDVACFYSGSDNYGVRDILLMYGVFGGTPRYHALVDPTKRSSDEIIALLMQPRAVLENEVRFLLGSEQIRDPAPYNAVLGAIAGGETQAGGIQNRVGVERGSLSFYLRTLMDLGWIRREFPFGEKSERRALYVIADPFLAFWYRFIAPLASSLQFSDPRTIYDSRVAPNLPDYMGRFVFEDICAQWMRRHAQERLGLSIREMARYWNRDCSIEIDIMAVLAGDNFLFGECKWRGDSEVRLPDYVSLRAKAGSLPDARFRNNPSYIIFSAGGFSSDLIRLAASEGERLYLVSGIDLLDGHG